MDSKTKKEKLEAGWESRKLSVCLSRSWNNNLTFEWESVQTHLLTVQAEQRAAQHRSSLRSRFQIPTLPGIQRIHHHYYRRARGRGAQPAARTSPYGHFSASRAEQELPWEINRILFALFPLKRGLTWTDLWNDFSSTVSALSTGLQVESVLHN